MIDLFTTTIQYPTIPILTIIYFFVESIVTYDMRINQYLMTKSSTVKKLPSWVAIFIFIGWGIFIYFIFINWKYAIIIFVVRYILKLLPVLETIGEFLITPFDPNRKK